ncbi:putative prophage helix-turn-helix protein (plasmid) [Bacillus cereus]|nr:AimR family lysis-lysogeny pheromone receptor [Bacillus cereus]AJH60109.1 putative prophage helix-turn-helix protein [Bacillus cereus]AJK31953.1 putative prophage helix-turn-helix protein [Bacillus cereus]
MQEILNKISNQINFHRMSTRKIGKRINTTHVTISNFLNGKSQMKSNTYGELLKEVFPDDVNTRRMCCERYFSQTDKPMNKRLAMDYLAVHGEQELLKQLIDKEKTSHDKDNREWAYVYELIYLRNKGELSGNKLQKRLHQAKKEIKLSTTEMQILFEILSLFATADRRNFKVMNDTAVILLEEIDLISDPYLKISFEYKIKECMIQGLLMSGEVEKARTTCHEIINKEELRRRFPMIVATAYGTLGESYTFESFEMATHYINQAIEMLEKKLNARMSLRNDMMVNTIEFLKIMWKVGLNNVHPIHIAEKAYLQIQLGNNEKAIQMLERLKEENGELSAFQLYYLALAKNDKNLFAESLNKFEQLGNIFYSQLPKKNLGII